MLHKELNNERRQYSAPPKRQKQWNIDQFDWKQPKDNIDDSDRSNSEADFRLLESECLVIGCYFDSVLFGPLKCFWGNEGFVTHYWETD